MQGMDNDILKTEQELPIERKADDVERGAKKQRKSPTPRKYPYYGLKIAIEVAEIIYRKRGGVTSRAGLAESLGISKTSGALEMRIITAASFGVVVRKEGEIRTTDLARKIIKPVSDSEKAQALAEAFAHVPLFATIQRRFAGQPLPEEEGIKNLLERDFEIPKNQVNEAYNLMMNSAREAGLLRTTNAGTWLSILPEQKEAEEKKATQLEVAAPSEGAKGEPPSQLSLDSAMTGLLLKLPLNGRFKNKAERDRWKKSFDAVFEFLYPIEGEE